MKRCTKCGLIRQAEEFTVRRASKDGLSYVCRECANAYAKRRYNARDEECRERENARSRAWSAANHDKRIKITRAYTARNLIAERERKRLAAAKYRIENREEARMAGRAAAQARRHRMAGVCGAPHKNVIGRLLKKANGVCMYCGEKSHTMTIDHFTPLSQGGSGQSWNLVPCCASCNSSKKNQDPCAWIEKRFGRSRLIELCFEFERLSAARLP